MKKLLVTGASGFLGSRICRLAHDRWETVGTSFSNPIQIENVKIYAVDLADRNETRSLFSRVRPDAVVHTAAVTNPDRCQLDPDATRKLNIDASLQIAELSAESGIPCVFTSSDLVFDGKNSPYSETDQPTPVSIYGEQKVEAERGMTDIHRDAIICRVPLMYGAPGIKPTGGIQRMIATMMRGESINLFTDQFRTPASGQAVAEGILLAIENRPNILHLGGPQRVSRLELGLMLADVFELQADLLVPCRQSDVTMPAPRPPDVSLDSSKAFSLGYHPRSLIEELRHLRTASRPQAV